MWRVVVPALLVAALASCGTGTGAANQVDGGAAVDHAITVKLDLTSPAFHDGQPIPTQYSCDGANQSPPLHWGDPPSGTRSFALVIDDPDAPGGTFHHWGIYDIPASARTISVGQSPGSQAVNDKGTAGYTGPCPPKGSGPHHYHFKLFALGVDKLGLGANPKVIDVENEASKHTIAQGELIGTYERR